MVGQVKAPIRRGILVHIPIYQGGSASSAGYRPARFMGRSSANAAVGVAKNATDWGEVAT